ncbi:MAG: family 43 glycosylhydrolase [Phycisphaerae bacterium]
MWKWVCAVVVVFVAGCSGAREGHAREGVGAWSTIHNDFYWRDESGARILTRSGCLREFGGTYYWSGGNPRGFREQYCYASKDLVHWVNKGVVFRQAVDANRVDVLRCPKTGQYVMFLKYNGNGAHLAIATAARPEGPFEKKWEGLVDGALMGDMSMFQDEDGRAYLAYVSWAVGTNAQHGIYRMSADYLSLEKRMYLWDVRGREAPHIFKREGVYYYGTSRTAWIDSTPTKYYMAKSLEGPWSEAKEMETPGSRNSWDTQVDFVYPIRGEKGTVWMFAGDRWLKDVEKGRNGDYVWLPMVFGEDGVPRVDYRQDWEVNLKEGEWRGFDEKRDLALGKEATASSEVAGHGAGNVTKGTTWEDYAAYRWESAASDPQWVRVDLGEVREVNRVVLKWGAYAAKVFSVETSVDGVKWEGAYREGNGSSFMVTDVRFAARKARYVRMVGTERAAVMMGRRIGTGPRVGAGTRPARMRPREVVEVAGVHGYSVYRFEVMGEGANDE